MKLLKVDTIQKAREKTLSHVKRWRLKTETLPLNEIQNRILAEDVYASCDIPSFRRSTVDGYAVVSKDTSGAGEAIPVFLKQVGAVSMGKAANFSIKSGECAYVPTGGMLPEGADAVVMIEYTEQIVMSNEQRAKNNEQRIMNNKQRIGCGEQNTENRENSNIVAAVYESVAYGTGMIQIGEDFKNGDMLLGKGTFIRPQEIGSLSAAGKTLVSVFTSLKVGIISTGDELVTPGDNPALGEVRDINTNSLKALAEKYGYNVISVQVLGDDEALLETAAKDAAALCDIVLISGGSSQGEKDFTKKIIDRISKPGVFTHGLAVKPGKPTILGWDEESQTLFAGLPGHPVSALMIFELLFGPSFIKELYQIPHSSFLLSRSLTARICCNIPGSPGKSLCIPVILSSRDGIYSAQPVFGKAGMISILTRADGYIIIDINKEGLNKDDIVQVFLF